MNTICLNNLGEGDVGMAWKKVKTFLIIISLVFILFSGVIILTDELIPPTKAAKTIYVDCNGYGDYTTIQAAIDNATSGDTIHVWEGTYYENVLVNKTVSLVGNGTDETVIDGGNNNVSIIKITANWVNVTGFYIKNSGPGTSWPYPAGIELSYVENVSVHDNNCSNNGNGILLLESDNNKIFNNHCFYSTYNGIFLYFSDKNKLENNTCMWGSWYGIYIYYSNSNVVKNNFCSYCSQGILIRNAEYNLFDSNLCNDNFNYGIWLYYSNHNTIINSKCNSNTHNGILSYSSIYNTISNNQFFKNYAAGVLTYYSDFETITDNICNSTWVVGLALRYSTNIKLKNNELQNCTLYMDADELKYWNTHTIPTSNKIDGKSIYYYKDQTQVIVPDDAGQIIFANCTKSQIKNQYLRYGIRNIMLAFSSSNIISNNFLISTTHGMHIISSDNNTFQSNSFLDGNRSFRLFHSSNNIIENNTASSDLEQGLYIESGNGNQIKSNNFNLNTNYGFSILSSNNNLFMNNNLSKNRIGALIHSSYNNKIYRNMFSINNEYGLLLNSSNNNWIYHNNFLNNPVQADIDNESKNNYWDNNEQEGNYWSDYEGLDNGADNRTANDGIGDTELPHLELDNYPFINSSGWLAAGLPILYDPGEVDDDGCYYVEWYPSRGSISYILEEDTDPEFKFSKKIYYGSDTTFYVSNKSNGTYYYRLKSIGWQFDSPWSNIVDISIDWPPAKPKNLIVAVFPEGNALNLSWETNAEDVNFYELYYKSWNMNNWNLLASKIYPEHTFDHTGLVDGKEYSYRLQAWDDRGQYSEFSAIVSGIPNDSVAPKPPVGLKITETTNNSIKLEWNQNTESDIEGYNIYRFTIAKPDSWGDLIGSVQFGTESYLDVGLDELSTYYYALTGFDEVPNESNISAVISGTTKISAYGPEINVSVPDFSINEDCYDCNTINLKCWFCDRNNDELIFWCEGSENISVTIFQENGTVIIKPKENWYGEEILTFFASDGVFEVSDDVKITIRSINDPPHTPIIIEPIDLLIIQEDKPVNFTGQCYDFDLPDDELTFKWISSLQGELGFGEKLVNITLIPGLHRIELLVTDREGECVNTTISLSVLKVRMDNSNDEKVETDYSAIFIGIVIVVILIILLFIFIYKKQKTSKELSKTSEPAVSRFSLLSLKVSESSEKEREKIKSKTKIKKE